MGELIAVDFEHRTVRRAMPTLPNQSAWTHNLVKVLHQNQWSQERIVDVVLAMVDFDRYVRSDMDTRRVVDRYLRVLGYV